MAVWYALLDGTQEDFVHLKGLFPTSNFAFEEIDGKFALSAPVFSRSNDRDSALDAMSELIAAINTSLRLSVRSYSGVDLNGAVERREDGTVISRVIFAGGVASDDSFGAAAVSIAGSIGRPARSKEERLVSLLGRVPEIAGVAREMTTRPLTWSAMNIVYESAKRLASTKTTPKARSNDHRCLVDRGWISEGQSNSFYYTAKHWRHGFPREPVEAGVVEMQYDDATVLIGGLFWRLVNHLEPE